MLSVDGATPSAPSGARRPVDARADAAPAAADRSSPLPAAAVVQVAVQAHVGLLDYAAPAALLDELVAGTPVRVQLGRRTTSGYVVRRGAGARPGLTLKSVLGLDDGRPSVPPVLLELILFAAAHYAAPPGELLAAALPARARVGQGRFVLTDAGRKAAQDAAGDAPPAPEAGAAAVADAAATHAPESHALAAPAPASGPEAPPPARRGEVRTRLLALGLAHPRGFALPAARRVLGGDVAQARGAVQRLVVRGELAPLAGSGVDKRREPAFVHLAGADGAVLGPRLARARALLDLMPVGEQMAASALRRLDAQATRLLRALMRYGLVGEGEAVPVAHLPRSSGTRDAADIEADAETAPGGAVAPPLTQAQAAALAEILAGVQSEAYAAYLLFGVTGSGKTEVYLQAIAAALSAGKTALVLVPEIALTPQLGARFRARFGDEVATFHSGLSQAERQTEWERVADGRARIGLGARSALFLPLRRLGVVVVDEEHESSFKQDESPRYHARDLAVWRARAEGATIVLGSATPSLETWHNAALGRYRRLDLPERVSSRPLPPVEVVPLQSSERVGSGIFTKVLLDALTETFGKGEQAILFLNRRGYAPYVFCRECGHSFRCLACDVALTLHQRRGRLVCHYCGETHNAPDACPSCAGVQVETFGLGTERVEEEVRLLFPQVALARLDRDTVRRRQDLEQVLRSFRRGQAQLLVGTQMVAKGHDFPGVTLVGVIAADASLNFPDFRAAERTFQLLAQVAGRAGRGDKPGRVIVQAFEHGHYAVQAAAQHNYEGFVREELRHREELGYPPHGHLVRIRYEGENEAQTRKAAEDDACALRLAAEAAIQVPGVADVLLLGPAPAPLARLRGLFRHHILLKGPSRAALRAVLTGVGQRQARGVRTVVDVDPVNML